MGIKSLYLIIILVIVSCAKEPEKAQVSEYPERNKIQWQELIDDYLFISAFKYDGIDTVIQ